MLAPGAFLLLKPSSCVPPTSSAAPSQPSLSARFSQIPKHFMWRVLKAQTKASSFSPVCCFLPQPPHPQQQGIITARDRRRMRLCLCPLRCRSTCSTAVLTSLLRDLRDTMKSTYEAKFMTLIHQLDFLKFLYLNRWHHHLFSCTSPKPQGPPEASFTLTSP